MTWIIVIAVFILIIFWTQGAVKKAANIEDAFNKDLNAKGIDTSSKIILGTYVGGHPDLDNMTTHVFSFKYENSLTLYAKLYKKPGNIETVYYDHLADIPIDRIGDITIEDISSIEKKVTLGRVLLVGVFALAWKKDKKKQQAFVNIEWNNSSK